MCPLKFSRTSDIQQAWNSTNLALESWNSTTSVVPHNNSPVFSIPTSKKWNIKNLVVRISHTYSSSKDHLINIFVTAFNFFSPQLITKSLPLVILIFYVCTALDKVFWRPTQISVCLSTRYKKQIKPIDQCEALLLCWLIFFQLHYLKRFVFNSFEAVFNIHFAYS